MSWLNWFKPKPKITTVEALIAQEKNLWEIMKWCEWAIWYCETPKMQTPEETLRLRKGECLDMSILTYEICKRLNFKPQIWRGSDYKNNPKKKIGHAIVMFPVPHGWTYISNFQVVNCSPGVRTEKDVLDLAMPDMWAYIQMDENGKMLRAL